MGVVTVVALSGTAADEVVQALRRSGVPAPLVLLDHPDGEAIPPASVYVIVDERGVPASRLFRSRVSKMVARNSIVYSPSLPARDIAELDRLGIRFFCNGNNGIQQLFRLIGQIKADVLMDARERVVEAEAVAISVFNATASALDLFAAQTSYDRNFYTTLSDGFVSRMRNTSLFLLIDKIQREQDTTIQHCALVTTLATSFAAHLGFPASEMERVFLAAFFHDIGKSSIPKAVIDKPGRLTDDEMRLMRTHVTVGHELLRRFPDTAGEIADVALHHHEYLDGSGYPEGLKGSEISDLVRLITISDIYAALVERRAYKPPFSSDKAFSILREMGPKLDQDLVGIFQPVAESVGVLAATDP